MNKKIAIKVENLSKIYRLGQVGTGTISHDLKRWWARTRGQEDPYLKIGMVNDRTKKSDSDYSWALRDINFEVNAGEVLGIIGNNGAGKSTLLKILSRITSPSDGKIGINGRIASLLEVGTGFHPEMTGGENIYMNGAILGMTKREIKDNFDAIVNFAGIARYVDTPVKRYSSGMYVRLAFAVAAHLQSEILIVDEVLAVGDMDFQKKCLSKMNDISKSEGRTVLFVSHNLPSVQSLCTRAISLQNGGLRMTGGVNEVIEDYLKKDTSGMLQWEAGNISSKASHAAYVTNVVFVSPYGNFIQMGDDIVLRIAVFLRDEMPPLQLMVSIYNNQEQLITTIYNTDFLIQLGYVKGLNESEVVIPKPNLLPGTYSISVSVRYNYSEVYDTVHNCVNFDIQVSDVSGSGIPFYADRGILWLKPVYTNITKNI